MRMTNFHTHTARCKHARNTDEEYVQAAIEAGYEEFGFADHTPWPYTGGFVSGIRMDVEQLDEYLSTLRGLKQKYEGQLAIHAGLECEYFPAYLDWLKRTIDEKKISYVILGCHSDLTDDGGFYFGDSCKPEHIYTYTERVLAAMRTGLFAYVAHPDLVMRGYPGFDKACEEMAETICQAAVELKLPLEYNLMGNAYKTMTGLPWKGVGYPDDHFWRIAAKHGCTAIIGLDSHNSAHVAGSRREYEEAAAYLEGLGMKRIDQIPMRG